MNERIQWKQGADKYGYFCVYLSLKKCIVLFLINRKSISGHEWKNYPFFNAALFNFCSRSVVKPFENIRSFQIPQGCHTLKLQTFENIIKGI